MELWGRHGSGVRGEWMGGEALEASSVNSPFDKFHDGVKEGVKDV